MRDMRIETAAAGGQLGQLRQLSHIATIILVLISPINSGVIPFVHRSIDRSAPADVADTPHAAYTQCAARLGPLWRLLH